MLQQSSYWQTGAWYQFLSTPSPIAAAGGIDAEAMEPYHRTLSISMGHRLVASMDKWLGFELGAAVLYVVIATLMATAVYLLALHWTESRSKAFLISFVVIISDAVAMGHIGACGSLAQAPSRDYLALSLFLFAMYFLLNGKYVTHTLFLYVGFLFHLSHGIFAFLMLLPLAYWQTNDVRKFLAHIAGFAVIAMGLYLYQSAVGIPIDADVKALWFKWAYIFNGGHIFIDHSIGYLLPDYAFVSLIGAGTVIALADPRNRWLFLSMLTVWGVIAIAATAMIYVLPVMLVYQLTPYRSSLLLAVVCAIFLLRHLIDRLYDDNGFWTRGTALFGLVAMSSSTFVGLSVAAILGLILLQSDLKKGQRIFPVVVALSIGLILVLNKAGYTAYDMGVVARDKQVWGIVFVSALVIMAVARMKLFGLNKGALAVVAAFLVGGVLAYLPSRYVSFPDQERMKKLEDYKRAAAVIASRSQVQDPILSAPLIDMPMLEVVANRGSVFQLPKAHIAYLAPNLLPDFDAILRDFGINITQYNGNWVSLVGQAPDIWQKHVTKERLLLLGKKHHSPLMITYSSHRLDLPLLYSGTHFAVYATSE